TQSTSDLPPSKATVASGGDIDTVSLSSLSKSFWPKVLATAICNMIACTATLTDGTAMRSLSFRSLTVLTSGLRQLSKNGCELSAETPRTSCGVPLVFAHSVSSRHSAGCDVNASGQQRVVDR